MSSHILVALANGDYQLTFHAWDRMCQRNVSHDDIRSCGKNGMVSELPDGKIRVTGRDQEGDKLVLICIDEGGLEIITVY